MGNKNGKEKKMDISQIKKINPKIIDRNGNLMSFKEQLFDIIAGTYDTTYPLVISPESKSLSYIDGVNEKYPIVFRPGKVFKLVNDHQLEYSFLGNLQEELNNSVLAFDSRAEANTKVLLLDRRDHEGNLIIAAIQTNATVGYVSVNRVASVYGKKDTERFLTLTYNEDYQFYKNKKTEQFIVSNKLQLPTSLITALSDSNYKQMFRKSQVEKQVENNENLNKASSNKGKWLNQIKAENSEKGNKDRK